MKSRRTVVALAVLLFCLAGLAQAESKVKVKGLIIGRTGDSLVLKTQNGNTVTVALTDDTKVQQPKGLIGLRRKQMPETALIPGLKVSVDGTGDPTSQVTAKSITFDSSDLQLAETIQAGLNPTANQVATNQGDIATNQENISANQQGIAANKVQNAANLQQINANQQDIATNQQDIAATTKRFNDLSDYETKGDTTVNFAVGSSTLSSDAKTALSQLAQSAVGLTGYIIEVKGFADSSGNATMNQALSMDRAQEVIAYLIQNCNIPVRHIVAPGAMGTADPTASNETSSGRAENRRVEVKVLINKGLAST